MKNLLPILFTIILLYSSCTEDVKIAKEQDLSTYLNKNRNKNLQACETEISFWLNKNAESPNIMYQSKLAALYEQNFSHSGDINFLLEAEKILLQINENHKSENAGILRMLASNAISQHKFKEAYEYASLASSFKDKQFASYLVLFDACMELGYYTQAEGILNFLEEKTSFDYLIRLAKWKDHQGELDEAVELMELAQNKISANNTELLSWTKSNLADMYGHQGKVEQAYKTYLEVLAIDSNHNYALKGIAYIAYAHDKNTKLAKSILKHLKEVHPIPDYQLMLAEIEDYENNSAGKTAYTNSFLKGVNKELYGNMYNKYLLEIALEKEDYELAIQLAEAELKNRASPQCYDWLSWTYYKAGKYDDALLIAKNYVENKSFEPEVSFHLGIIYSKIDPKKAKDFLLEASEASFELGPKSSLEIQEALSSI